MDCSQCQEAQGDVFSAERAESEQGDSILFEPLQRKEEGSALILYISY